MNGHVALYGFGKAVEWAFAGSKPTQKDKGRARRYRRRHRLAIEVLDWDIEGVEPDERQKHDE